MKTCQALDQDGLRCGKRKNTIPIQYHGDSELYSGLNDPPCEPCWVLVWLCPEHRNPRTKYERKAKNENGKADRPNLRR